ncbi:scarecrow-like protein 14 [Tanacetum coccineum]
MIRYNMWRYKDCSRFGLESITIIQAMKYGVYKIWANNVKKKRQVVDVTELLVQCAEKVALSDATGVVEILKMIRKHSSPNGSSSERMAHYFANAYITACPFHRMSNIYANKSIMKLVKGRDKAIAKDWENVRDTAPTSDPSDAPARYKPKRLNTIPYWAKEYV